MTVACNRSLACTVSNSVRETCTTRMGQLCCGCTCARRLPSSESQSLLTSSLCEGHVWQFIQPWSHCSRFLRVPSDMAQVKLADGTQKDPQSALEHLRRKVRCSTYIQYGITTPGVATSWAKPVTNCSAYGFWKPSLLGSKAVNALSYPREFPSSF